MVIITNIELRDFFFFLLIRYRGAYKLGTKNMNIVLPTH